MALSYENEVEKLNPKMFIYFCKHTQKYVQKNKDQYPTGALVHFYTMEMMISTFLCYSFSLS